MAESFHSQGLPILLVAPVAPLAIELKTLRSALQGLDIPMSFTLISGDRIDSEKCVFVVLEFSTFDHAEDALNVLNMSSQKSGRSVGPPRDDTSVSPPFIAGIPLVLKSLSESYTDAMLQDLICPFGSVIYARISENLGGVVLFRTKNEAMDAQKNAGQAQILLEELDYSNCWQLIGETTADDDEPFQVIDDLDTRDIILFKDVPSTRSKLTDLMLSLARRFISNAPQAISGIILPTKFSFRPSQPERTNGSETTIETRCSDLEATIRELRDEISGIRRATENKLAIGNQQIYNLSSSQSENQQRGKHFMPVQLSKLSTDNALRMQHSVMEQILELLVDLGADESNSRLESLTATMRDPHASTKRVSDTEALLSKIRNLESGLATLREERNREREERLAEIQELRELRAELVRGGRGAPLSKERIQNSKSTTEGVQRTQPGEERRLPRDSRKTKATLSDIQRIDVDATMIPSAQTPLALLRPRTGGSRRTLVSANEEK